MIQKDFSLLEGAEYRMRVTLTDEAGAALDPALYHVYAGAFCPGFAPVRFRAECTETEWQLTMPGLKAGRVPWSWQLIAAEAATGVEWLLAGGEIEPLPRYAVGSGYVDPDELEVQAALDKTTLQMTVTLGESTAACSLAVVDARQSAAAAAASAEAAAGSAGESAASAEAAADSAHDADGRADDASASAADAQTYAEAAAGSAEAASRCSADAAASAAMAAGSATEAAGHATAAAGSASNAATSSHAAANSASDAIEAADDSATSATAAATSASNAATSATAAATSASNAATSATAAATSAAQASQQATAAATSASNAATSATAAAASADAAAETLAGAAQVAENNTFTGTNTFNGQLVVNNALFYGGTELGDYITQTTAAGDAAALGAFGVPPLNMLPTSIAEWKELNPDYSSATNVAIAINSQIDEAVYFALTAERVLYVNVGAKCALKQITASKSLYIHDAFLTAKDWSYVTIKAPLLVIDLPNALNIGNMFYGITADTLYLSAPKLKSFQAGNGYTFNHNTTVRNVRFYTPSLDQSGTMFNACPLTAASLLSLANTLPVATAARTITIGADATLEADSDFQAALATALSGKKYTFNLVYNTYTE